MLASIRDCFVTGKWEGDKDAATLLKEDGKDIVSFFFSKELGILVFSNLHLLCQMKCMVILKTWKLEKFTKQTLHREGMLRYWNLTNIFTYLFFCNNVQHVVARVSDLC